jgi:hypothetical protein
MLQHAVQISRKRAAATPEEMLQGLLEVVKCEACDASYAHGPDACMHAKCTTCDFAFCGFCFKGDCRAECCNLNPADDVSFCDDKDAAILVLKTLRVCEFLETLSPPARSALLESQRDVLKTFSMDPDVSTLCVLPALHQTYMIENALQLAYKGKTGLCAPVLNYVQVELGDVLSAVVGERLRFCVVNEPKKGLAKLGKGGLPALPVTFFEDVVGRADATISTRDVTAWFPRSKMPFDSLDTLDVWQHTETGFTSGVSFMDAVLIAPMKELRQACLEPVKDPSGKILRGPLVWTGNGEFAAGKWLFVTSVSLNGVFNLDWRAFDFPITAVKACVSSKTLLATFFQ